MFEIDTFPYIFPIPHIHSEMNVRINGGKGAELVGYANTTKYKNLVKKFKQKYKLKKAEEMASNVFHNI